VKDPAPSQPPPQPRGTRLDFSDVQRAQETRQADRRARSQFVLDAQQRWKTEARRGDHEGAHRPGELDFQYEDDLSMPTFIRKQMD